MICFFVVVWMSVKGITKIPSMCVCARVSALFQLANVIYYIILFQQVYAHLYLGAELGMVTCNLDYVIRFQE